MPPFIPRAIGTGEDVHTSWIFMGSPGPGAQLHVSFDNVMVCFGQMCKHCVPAQLVN